MCSAENNNEMQEIKDQDLEVSGGTGFWEIRKYCNSCGKKGGLAIGNGEHLCIECMEELKKVVGSEHVIQMWEMRNLDSYSDPVAKG